MIYTFTIEQKTSMTSSYSPTNPVQDIVDKILGWYYVFFDLTDVLTTPSVNYFDEAIHW